MTFELQMLFWTAIVMIVTLAIQGALTPLTQGFGWALGSRDVPREISPLQGRMRRIVSNHVEGIAVFAALILVAHLAGVSNSLTQTGALLFVLARIAYVGVYMLGIPVLRTVVWSVGTVGLFLIAAAILPQVL